MRVIRDLTRADNQRDTVLTIGAFDGLHRGHRELLQAMMCQAERSDRSSAVVTFDPLPRAVLQPHSNTVCLTAVEDKIELLSQWGLDVLVVVAFTRELARTSANSFVQVLRRQLRMAELWIGWDFALGHKREGDAAALERLGGAMGFGVHVVEPVSEGSTVISSTKIRQLIVAGRVREAAGMLGRRYQVRATVVAGRGRGRRLGYPTANLDLCDHCAFPRSGVFAAYVLYGEERYRSVVNIGCRPTFAEKERVIEAHLLGFEGTLYGDLLRLQLVERLRPEHRFSGPEALAAQIEKDVARTSELLA